jgi:hypothetical protein
MHAASSKELQSYEHKQQQLQVDIAQVRQQQRWMSVASPGAA